MAITTALRSERIFQKGHADALRPPDRLQRPRCPPLRPDHLGKQSQSHADHVVAVS